jgi:AraC-like DNA-binding protein
MDPIAIELIYFADNSNIPTMHDLEPTLRAFERQTGCTLTLHDRMHVLFDGDTPLVPPERHSHRKTFPHECGQENRDACVRRCDTEVDEQVAAERPRCFRKTCPRGLVELVAPAYRSGIPVVTFFAGIWRPPLDEAALRSIKLLLPVFAAGLVVAAADFRSGRRSGDTQAGRIHEFIALNYNRAVSTADLAAALCLSLTRTCHVVREHCGDNFESLLMKQRIHHARLYLRNSTYRIGEIGQLCGFSSFEHFTRAFRKCTGMAPGHFRQWRRQALHDLTGVIT